MLLIFGCLIHHVHPQSLCIIQLCASPGNSLSSGTWSSWQPTTDHVLSQLNAFHITTFSIHCAFKYYLCQELPSGLFPSVLCASTHPRYVPPPAHPPLFDIANNNTSEVYYESFVICILSFFQSLCNSLCLESKYCPQHHIPICPILRHVKCVCPLLSAGTNFRLCLW